MCTGWIKLHRKMVEWEWYDDVNTFRLFVHLLLTVNHEQKKWRGIVIEPGQIVTGRQALSEQTGLTEKQIRVALHKLENSEVVAIKRTNQYSTITIVKWEDYQQTGDKGASNEAGRGPAKGRRRASEGPPLKNDKNDKNNNLNIIPPVPCVPASPSADNRASAEEESRKRVAVELARRILDDISAAKQRVLTAKTDHKPVLALMKRGITAGQIGDAVRWLCKQYKSGAPYTPEVQSCRALEEKWDKIQSAMEREKNGSGNAGTGVKQSWLADATIKQNIQPRRLM